MWLLGRILPVMLGHLVPEDDEHWKNFILLLKILEMLVALSITIDECVYLQVHIIITGAMCLFTGTCTYNYYMCNSPYILLNKVLIDEHHNAFIHLYPNSSVIPKLHYMIHMARIMMKLVTNLPYRVYTIIHVVSTLITVRYIILNFKCLL